MTNTITKANEAVTGVAPLAFDGATYSTEVGHFTVRIERINPGFFRVSVRTAADFLARQFGMDDFRTETEAREYAGQLVGEVREELARPAILAAERKRQAEVMVQHEARQARAIRIIGPKMDALRSAYQADDGVVRTSRAFPVTSLAAFLEAGLMTPVEEDGVKGYAHVIRCLLVGGRITDKGRRRYESELRHQADTDPTTRHARIAELLAAA